MIAEVEFDKHIPCAFQRVGKRAATNTKKIAGKKIKKSAELMGLCTKYIGSTGPKPE